MQGAPHELTEIMTYVYKWQTVFIDVPKKYKT